MSVCPLCDEGVRPSQEKMTVILSDGSESTYHLACGEITVFRRADLP